MHINSIAKEKKKNNKKKKKKKMMMMMMMMMINNPTTTIHCSESQLSFTGLNHLRCTLKGRQLKSQLLSND